MPTPPSADAAPWRPRLVPRGLMPGRDPHEAHRAATPLELLFDLCFVVGIAAAASSLHHAVGSGHVGHGLAGFGMAFFAVWWAWMNFTWFASAFDVDDGPYRVMTMIQMVGVVIMASGIPGLVEGHYVIPVVGYAVMRVGLVAQWLRAARDNPTLRRTCLRYAVGLSVVQVAWIARLWMPASWLTPAFLLLAMIELAVPAWAESAGRTPWHPHHVAERYGGFAIIGLGECVLGATNSVAGVVQAQGLSFDVGLVAMSIMLLVMSLWWLYFMLPSGEALHRNRNRSFVWGYAHFFVLAAIAAVGAFLEVVADDLKVLSGSPDAATHGAAGAHGVSATLAIALVAAAVATYGLALWFIHVRLTRHRASARPAMLMSLGALAGSVLAVRAGLPLPWGLALVALSQALSVAWAEHTRRRDPEAFAIRD